MRSSDGPILNASDVSRIFGSGDTAVTALSAINLIVQEGDFLAVTGRSGSGKTTLLNLLSGLDRPTTRRHKIGFVFQSFGLIPLLSAQENVELPLHIGGMSWRERRQKVNDSLNSVGLGTRARHRPFELSGGEQQRVSIARALVTQPELIFADEPTGELDATTAESIVETLAEVAASRRATVIVATHDLDLADTAQRRLDLVDGRVVSDV